MCTHTVDCVFFFFFFQAEDGIRDSSVTGVQTCALPISMLDHLIGVARDRGCRRVSLETGSMDAFAPARSLYASAGFRPSGPFGDYSPAGTSMFMTLSLDG